MPQMIKMSIKKGNNRVAQQGDEDVFEDNDEKKKNKIQIKKKGGK